MTPTGLIPAIIHQMWKTGTIPERFSTSAESWRRFHPGWQYRLWTDETIEAFVREKYPSVVPLFLSYPDHIQRVDAARYMILFHFGGVYSDLDIECLRSFDALRVHEAVLPKTRPVGYSNDLMMCVPGHAMFGELIDRLSTSQRRWGHWFIPRHFRIMLTAGPLHLTNTFRSFGEKNRVHVLEEQLYSSQNRDVAYVYHWPGNTWAKWDTHLFVFIQHHWRLGLLFLVLLLFGLFRG